MKRWIKLLLVAVLTVAVFLVTAVVLVMVFVDADALRPSIEETLSETVGRKVALGELTVKPGLGVRVGTDRFEIGDPLDPSVEPGPTLLAEKVRMKVALLPVLRGEVDVRSLRFRDGVVEYADQVLFSEAVLQSRLRAGSEGRISMNGNLVGRADLFGNARTDVDFAAVLDGDVLKIDSLAADLGPGTLGATGQVSGIEQGVLNVELDATAEFGNTHAAGTVGGRFLEDATRITFAISSPFVDLDELAAMAGWVEETGATASTGGLFPAAHAAETGGGEAVASTPIYAAGTLKAERGSFLGLELQSMVAELRFDDGSLVFEEAAFDLYGGKHAGSFGIEIYDPDLPFKLADRLEGVDLDALLTAFSPDLGGTVYGKANLSMDLGGRAGDPSPDGTVAGDASLLVDDGRLSGVGLLGLISEKIAGAGGKAAGDRVDTPFERLSADFKVENREMETSNLQFRSPDLNLDGKGRVTFEGGLDLDLVASFSPEVSASLVAKVPKLDFRVGNDGRLSIPLRLDGNIAGPGVSIDLEKILKQGLKEKLRDRFDGLLRRRKK